MRAELATGRFGPVYLGREPSSGSRVVIRAFGPRGIWHDPGEREDLLESFRKLCAANVDHPSVARHVACGIEGNILFLASAYFPGTSMEALISEEKGPPLAEVLERVAQIGSAIDAAAAICHHGMIEPRGLIFDVKGTGVTGFGLAQALMRAGVHVEARSPYASPQRLAGAPPTRADDVYSLAAVALELVIGKSTVATEDPSGALRRAQGLPERRRVPRPAPHETRRFTAIPGVDAGKLRAVFAAALSERPTERPPTGAEFVASFEQALHGRRPGADRVIPGDADPVGMFPAEEEARPAPSAIDLPLQHSRPEPQLALSFAEPVIREVPALALDTPSLSSPPVESAPARGRGRALPLVAALTLGMIAGFTSGFMAGQRSAASDSTSVTADAVPVPQDVLSPRAGPSAAAQAPDSAPADPPTLVEAPTPIPEPAVADAVPDPPAAPEPARPDAPSGRILVRSTPAGAGVTIDGLSRGVTPLALRDLALSDHTIEVSYPGHDTRQQRVTLTPGRPARSVDFELQLSGVERGPAAAGAPGALQVESRPVGAQVFIDEILVGTTPLLVPNVSPGSHRIRLQLSGFQSWSTSVQVEAGTRFRVAASLEQ